MSLGSTCHVLILKVSLSQSHILHVQLQRIHHMSQSLGQFIPQQISIVLVFSVILPIQE